jgi:hypothetical protein
MYCHVCGTHVAPTNGDNARLRAEFADLHNWVKTIQHATDDNRRLLSQHADAINCARLDIDRSQRLLETSRVFRGNFWPRAWAIFGHALAVAAPIAALIGVVLFFLLRR